MKLFAAAAFALVACSSTDKSAGFDGGAGNAGNAVNVGDAAVVVHDQDGGACNTVDNAAPSVNLGLSGDAAPVGMGGSIQDGTYFLRSEVLYSTTDAGVTAAQLGSTQSTLVISNGVAQTVELSSLGGGMPDTATATYVVSGSTVTLTDTCPDNAVTTATYTASGDTLAIIIPEGDTASAVTIYALQ